MRLGSTPAMQGQSKATQTAPGVALMTKICIQDAGHVHSKTAISKMTEVERTAITSRCTKWYFFTLTALQANQHFANK